MSEIEQALAMGDNAEHDDLECEEEEEEVFKTRVVEGDEEPEVVLPPEVKKRVKALKKIQVEITKIEAKFYEEMHELECKYLPMYTSHFEKRKTIVDGTYEPTENECDFVGDSESDSEELAKNMAKMAVNGDNKEAAPAPQQEPVSGIPEFWLTIFRNVDMLSEMTQEYDEPIIKHLEDIKVEMTDKPMGFKLLFFFSNNEYFTNTVLTKAYEMKCELDTEDPFSFEGPEIVKCTGCTIDWKEGKNITFKTINKKQKHKKLGSIRTIIKTVEAPSFFNFFSPPTLPVPDADDNANEELDEDIQMILTNDFEIGQYIRERIIPRAVLYFTGEALDDFDSDMEEEEEEDDEEDDDDDDKE